MAEQRSDDLLRSREESALLLRLDPSNLSPSDALRCDLIATLRLSIDSAQADALEGRAADLGRLIVATESLVKLLPSEPPKPESQRDDPRVVLWNIIKEGRDRAALGFDGYDGKVRQVEALQAEVAALKAELAGEPAPALLTSASPSREKVITPSIGDIVSRGEQGETYAGKRLTPDDLKPMRPKPVIDAVATSAVPAPRPQTWDDTPNGKAWQAWCDAGGDGGFDRWSNRNF
jgi:hypothetical protein